MRGGLNLTHLAQQHKLCKRFADLPVLSTVCSHSSQVCEDSCTRTGFAALVGRRDQDARQAIINQHLFLSTSDKNTNALSSPDILKTRLSID
jgi:hypothetical protein